MRNRKTWPGIHIYKCRMCNFYGKLCQIPSDAVELDRSLGERFPVWSGKTLSKGMAQSYTDLAAQHGVSRIETFKLLHHRRYRRYIPRFTSRGIAHPTIEGAFPPYLQPEVTFIDGSNQVEMVDTEMRWFTNDLINLFKISRERRFI